MLGLAVESVGDDVTLEEACAVGAVCWLPEEAWPAWLTLGTAETLVSFDEDLFVTPAVATTGLASVVWLFTGEEDTGLVVLVGVLLMLLLLLLILLAPSEDVDVLAELPVDADVDEEPAGETVVDVESNEELDDAVEETLASVETDETPVDVVVGVTLLVEPAVLTELLWDVATLDTEGLATG